MPESPVTFDEAFLADPASAWERWRRAGPIHRARTPDGAPIWLVTDHRHARAAAADPRLRLDKRHARDGYAGFALPPALDRNLLNLDGDEHARVRRLLAAGFTPRRVEAVRPRITAIAHDLADDLVATLARQPTADLVATYAASLSSQVIAELLGLPPDERPDFRSWTDQMLDPPDARTAATALDALHRQLLALVARVRAAPGDDLLSDLVSARDGGGGLSEDELVSATFLLLFAGYENTTHVIGNGLVALLRHGADGPASLRARLVDRDTARRAVDELLRFDPPPQLAIRRFAAEDLRIADALVARGETVMLSWAAANHDPEVFASPDRLDLDRFPNPHLTLGHGPHVCLGAALAHAELEIGLRVLLDAVPDLELALDPAALRWRPSFRNRGLLELPVRRRGGPR